MTETEREQIVDAVTRVAERSLFAFAEAVPVDLMPRAIDGGWHVGTVSFTGPFNGRMSMAVPALLSGQIGGAVLGADDALEEPAVRDLVGEFVNMTCGAWLTARQEAACFELSHPDVVAETDVPACDLAFVINELPVKVCVTLGEARS